MYRPRDGVDAQAPVRFSLHTIRKVVEEIPIVAVQDVEASRRDELEIKEPSIQLVAVAPDQVGDHREIVEVQ